MIGVAGRVGCGLTLTALTLGSCAGVGAPVPGAPAHHRERGFANTSPGYVPAGAFARPTFCISRMWSPTVNPRAVGPPGGARHLPANRR